MVDCMILRVLVIALASLEVFACIALGFILFINATDPLGRNFTSGVAGLPAIAFLFCVLPALILGLADCWLPFALILAFVAGPVWLLLMRSA